MEIVIIDGQTHKGTETVSKSDYEGWLADTLGNAAEIEIPYRAMTEENIQACGVK